jgi:hypothetical protein
LPAVAFPLRGVDEDGLEVVIVSEAEEKARVCLGISSANKIKTGNKINPFFTYTYNMTPFSHPCQVAIGLFLKLN